MELLPTSTGRGPLMFCFQMRSKNQYGGKGITIFQNFIPSKFDNHFDSAHLLKMRKKLYIAARVHNLSKSVNIWYLELIFKATCFGEIRYEEKG